MIPSVRAGFQAGAWFAWAFLAACAGSETEAHQEAAPAAPELAAPIAASWTPSTEITGSLEPLQAVQLGFDVPGRLRSVDATRGQAVKKGDALGRLDDAMATAQLQQAEAALASAKAQLAAGESGWTRTQSLKDAGGVTDQQLADGEAGVLALRAARDQADAAVALARANLDHHTLRAPFDGVVTTAPDNAGAMVGAGTPLFTLENLDTLQVKAAIPESTSWVEAGQAATVRAGTVTAPAEVVRVLPSLDPSTRQLPIEIVVKDPPKTLRAHAFVRVELKANEPVSVLSVPKSSVIAHPDFSVFTIENDKPRRIPVDVLGDDPDHPGLVLVQGDIPGPVMIDPPTGL